MKQYFILDGQIPIEADLMTWAKFMETGNRIVRSDKLPGGVHVSTVFLGLNHAWFEGRPILFETMVFGGEHNGDQERYSTWEEAVEGHQEAIDRLKQKI